MTQRTAAAPWRVLLCLLLAASCWGVSASARAEGSTPQAEAERRLQVAEQLSQKGASTEAAGEAEAALRLREQAFGLEHPLTLQAAMAAGLLQLEARNLVRAEELLLRASKGLKEAKGPERFAYGVALGGLAQVYLRTNRARDALPLQEEAAAVTAEFLGRKSPEYAEMLGHVASTYEELGSYPEATSRYLQALQIVSGPEPAAREAREGLTEALAGCYLKQARYQEALPLARKVLAAHPLTDSGAEEHCSALCLLGSVHARMGDFGEAVLLLERAVGLAGAKLSRESLTRSRCMAELALVYRALGRNQEAAQAFNAAVLGYAQNPGRESLHFAAALDNALEFYSEVEPRPGIAREYQRVVELRQRFQGESHPDVAKSLITWAAMRAREGSLAEASALLRKSQEILERTVGVRHPTYWVALNNEGILLLRQGKAAQAVGVLQRVVELRKTVFGPRHGSRAVGLSNLATALELSGRHPEALSTELQALALEQRKLTTLFGFSTERAVAEYLDAAPLHLDALINLALLHPEDAVNRERACDWLLRRKGVVLEGLQRYRQAQQLEAADPAIRNKSQALQELRRDFQLAVLRPGAPKESGEASSAPQLTAAIERAESELARLVAGHVRWDDGTSASYRAVLAALPRDEALLEFVRIRTLAHGADAAGSWWSAPHYCVFVVRNGRPLRLIDLGACEEIDEAITEFRESVVQAGKSLARVSREDLPAEERVAEGELREIGARLYRKLIAPVVPLLEGVKQVDVTPDGELNRLPFEALSDPSGRYLVERYSFAYLSSGRDLLRVPSRSARGAAVFAGPDFDRVDPSGRPSTPGASGNRRSRDLRGLSWTALPGALREAGDVRSSLARGAYAPVQVFTGGRAGEAELKRLSPPRLLHLATHGFFLPDQQTGDDRASTEEPDAGFGAARGLARLRAVENPLLRSGVVLAGANRVSEPASGTEPAEDGWVTAEEIAGLDLRGTEVVVLSACDTGLGRIRCGEGVYGLRRAFQFAGARSLVLSLFKVPDEATHLLMQRFYRELAAGKVPRAAFYAAQRGALGSRRRSGGAAHPFYWGSFVYAGQ